MVPTLCKKWKFIETIGWDKIIFINTLDLAFDNTHCSGKVKVKEKKTSLSKFYSSRPSS